MNRCVWCGKQRKKWSKWEQRNIRTNKYERLCNYCATKRLNNPWNALLDMQKTEEQIK